VQRGTEATRAAAAHPGKEVEQSCPVGVRLRRGQCGIEEQEHGCTEQHGVVPRSWREDSSWLLYGDEFVLSVRVLGKSIRDTGTRRDMVVLISNRVSEYSRYLILED
jgi:hypothetical protein